MAPFSSVTIFTVLATIDFAGAASKHFLGVSPPSSGVVTSEGDAARLVSPDTGDWASWNNPVATRLGQVRSAFLHISQAPREKAKPITWKDYIIESFYSWATWFLLALIGYVFFYRLQSPVPQKKADVLPDQVRLEELLSNGHWQCFEDSNICVCSFFCSCLRWADTTSLAGWMTFLTAFAAFCFVALLNSITTGGIYGFFTAFLALYFRHQLRDKLGVESWTFATCCRDFCYICWCPCCAIAQEARIVKEAIQMGHEAFPAPTSDKPASQEPHEAS